MTQTVVDGYQCNFTYRIDDRYCSSLELSNFWASPSSGKVSLKGQNI